MYLPSSQSSRRGFDVLGDAFAELLAEAHSSTQNGILSMLEVDVACCLGEIAGAECSGSCIVKTRIAGKTYTWSFRVEGDTIRPLVLKPSGPAAVHTAVKSIKSGRRSSRHQPQAAPAAPPPIPPEVPPEVAGGGEDNGDIEL